MVFKRIQCCRRYNALSDLWVSSHDKVSDFHTSAWQIGDSAVPLLVLRVVLLVAALAILFWSMYEAGSVYWMLYLTNWGLMLVSIMFTLAVWVSVKALRDHPSNGSPLPGIYAAYWFMYNVAVSLAFLISALYWTLLYHPEELSKGPRRLFWLDAMTHGMNSVLAAVEVLTARTPLHAAHVYQPLCVGLWYAGFTAVYYAVGGKDGNGYPFIYDLLDWRHPKRSLAVVVMSSFALVVIYFIVYSVVLSRDKLSSVIFRSSVVKQLTATTHPMRHHPTPAYHNEEAMYYEPDEYV